MGFSRTAFLIIQLIGVVFFALTIPVSAKIAERGRRSAMIAVTLVIGLSLMGFTDGPLGTTLSELFPTRVRYTGSSLTFNLAGIFGASLAPYIATSLARDFGLRYVGYYLTAAAALTLVGLVSIRETKDEVF